MKSLLAQKLRAILTWCEGAAGKRFVQPTNGFLFVASSRIPHAHFVIEPGLIRFQLESRPKIFQRALVLSRLDVEECQQIVSLWVGAAQHNRCPLQRDRAVLNRASQRLKIGYVPSFHKQMVALLKPIE